MIPNAPTETIYTYQDERETALFDVVRTPEKRFFQRRPDGSVGLGNTRRVLYRLPRILQHLDQNSREPLYIVEGEKDVHAIEATGGVATCNPMGAGKWSDEYSAMLQGARNVYVIADKDGPGREHAQKVRESLARFGMTAEIVEAAEGKDASDHLAAGLLLADLLPAQLGSLQIVALEQFAATEELAGPPLLGEPDDALLPAKGFLLMYGDGGAGKTTLSVDAIAHIAAGHEWLQIKTSRPLRILLIENEGPRAPFRRVLANKIKGWKGDPFALNVSVLEEPWTQFTLADSSYREELAQQIDRLKTDVVVVGPLASLGAKGTGTPDDVNEFTNMIGDLRDKTEYPFSLWIVHHENKAGDVSGAWERAPDTLVHVSAQGNGRTRVWWRKVRWSSRLHNTSVQLLWAENAGYTIDEARERDYQTELLEAYQRDDRWRTAREAAGLISANQDKTRDALMDLVEAGLMTLQIGPPGRSPSAKCWKLRTDSDPPGHPESPGLFEVPVGWTDPLTPPIKESGGSGQRTSDKNTDPTPPSQCTSDNGSLPDPDDDLRF